MLHGTYGVVMVFLHVAHDSLLGGGILGCLVCHVGDYASCAAIRFSLLILFF